MRNRALRLLCVGFLWVITTVSADTPARAGTAGRIALRRVYGYKDFCLPRDMTNVKVKFTPDSQHVFLMDHDHIEVLDWKGNTIVQKTDIYEGLFKYKQLYGEKGCGLWEWKILPDPRYALAICCDALFVASTETYQFVKLVLPQQKGLAILGVAVSPASSYFAVRLRYSVKDDYEYSVRIYTAREWEPVAEWPMLGHHDAAITPDGRHLLLLMGDPEWNQLTRNRSKGEIRELPLGKLVASTDFLGSTDISSPFRIEQFLPGSDRLFVGDTLPHNTLGVWDFRSGELVRKIINDRIIGHMNITVSPDGRWLAAGLSDDPHDAPEGQQDFKIWDLTTGEVVYETRLMPWRFPLTLDQLESIFLDFSPDGRYLLVLKGKQLEVHEIMHQK